MQKKTLLITGSTDGIGLLTAKMLAESGHSVLLRGRSQQKLDEALAETGGDSQGYLADLSSPVDVVQLASAVLAREPRFDVLINNAGVLRTPRPRTQEGFDLRFMVNTFAPLMLTRHLMHILPKDGRIVNLSSAAQAEVEPTALAGETMLDDMGAYAQSKLAIMIWSQQLAKDLPDGPTVVAVNPGSLLASKMIKEGFGIGGNDLAIGAELLCDAALGERFSSASGQYSDNDAGSFAPPHPAAQRPEHVRTVMQGIEAALTNLDQKSH